MTSHLTQGKRRSLRWIKDGHKLCHSALRGWSLFLLNLSWPRHCFNQPNVVTATLCLVWSSFREDQLPLPPTPGTLTSGKVPLGLQSPCRRSPSHRERPHAGGPVNSSSQPSSPQLASSTVWGQHGVSQSSRTCPPTCAPRWHHVSRRTNQSRKPTVSFFFF